MDGKRILAVQLDDELFEKLDTYVCKLFLFKHLLNISYV